MAQRHHALRRRRIKYIGQRWQVVLWSGLQCDDSATASRFRLADARLCDDAFAQPRRGPRVAQGHGRRAVVHLPYLVEPPGAGPALRQLSYSFRARAVGIMAAAELAAARFRTRPDRPRLCDPD